MGSNNLASQGRPNWVPVGPSLPLHQVYNQLPFVHAPIPLTTRNMRCGRGMIVPVTTTAANMPTTIRHNLGRLVWWLIPLGTVSNVYPPRISLAAGVRSASEQAIQTDAPVSQLFVWFL